MMKRKKEVFILDSTKSLETRKGYCPIKSSNKAWTLNYYITNFAALNTASRLDFQLELQKFYYYAEITDGSFPSAVMKKKGGLEIV